MDTPTETLPELIGSSERPPRVKTDIAAPLLVLGIPFHPLRMNGCLDQIDQFIRERRPRQICLANAYTISLGRHSKPLLTALSKADLVLADGMSIVWGGRRLGIQIPERIAGPDLMEKLCARAETSRHRVFLMGSSWDNLKQLRDVLLKRWPSLSIAGLHSPSVCERFDETETLAILDEIHQAKPDILFVGVSAPKQEIWIAENLHRLNVPVCIGVGAAFDFLSGRIPRAPEYLRRIGLEWLYRLWKEPRRLWKRYLLGNAVFLSILARQFINRKITRPSNGL